MRAGMHAFLALSNSLSLSLSHSERNLTKTELLHAHALAAIAQAQVAQELARFKSLQAKDKELLAVGKRLINERAEFENMSSLLDS